MTKDRISFLEDKICDLQMNLKMSRDCVKELKLAFESAEAKLAEQSAIISGKTFHDVQEATARECLALAEYCMDAGQVETAIRKKYNIKN